MHDGDVSCLEHPSRLLGVDCTEYRRSAQSSNYCFFALIAAALIHAWQRCRAFQYSRGPSLVRSVPSQTTLLALKGDPEQVRCPGRGRDKRLHRTKGYRTISPGTTTDVCSALQATVGGCLLSSNMGGLAARLPRILVYVRCFLWLYAFCVSVPSFFPFPSLGVVNIL